MNLDEIKKRITDAANCLVMNSPSLGTSAGKAYETWVYLELAVGLQNAGCEVFPHNAKNQVISDFRVRGGPGHMPKASDPITKDTPCHFRVRSRRHEAEIHISLEVVGVSDATHELDICVMSAIVGERSRLLGGALRDRVAMGIELKAYDDARDLPMSIPRTVVGVAVDREPLWAIQSIGMTTQGGHLTQIYPRFVTEYALITTAGLSNNAIMLLEHHKVHVGTGQEPGVDTTKVSELIRRIAAMLEA